MSELKGKLRKEEWTNVSSKSNNKVFLFVEIFPLEEESGGK